PVLAVDDDGGRALGATAAQEFVRRVHFPRGFRAVHGGRQALRVHPEVDVEGLEFGGGGVAGQDPAPVHGVEGGRVQGVEFAERLGGEERGGEGIARAVRGRDV